VQQKSRGKTSVDKIYVDANKNNNNWLRRIAIGKALAQKVYENRR
jgi:hypothetical protein